ncbi:MAG: hypothetical protein QW540_08635 [Archaeoglobaceae archaeon]
MSDETVKIATIYDGSRIIAPLNELVDTVMEKKIVVVFEKIPKFGHLRIYTDKAIICSPTYQGYLKTVLGEVCLSKHAFLKYITNLTFVSDGFKVEPIKENDLPPWDQYASTYPLKNDKIATEFIPFLGAQAVIVSPLRPAAFGYTPETKTGLFAYKYISSDTHIDLLRKTKETALAVLEEETGIKRGKSYEELIQIAREKAEEAIKRERLKLFLKFESKISSKFEPKMAPNPLIPEELFPELKTVVEQTKEIPEDPDEQLNLLIKFSKRT